MKTAHYSVSHFKDDSFGVVAYDPDTQEALGLLKIQPGMVNIDLVANLGILIRKAKARGYQTELDTVVNILEFVTAHQSKEE